MSDSTRQIREVIKSRGVAVASPCVRAKEGTVSSRQTPRAAEAAALLTSTAKATR